MVRCIIQFRPRPEFPPVPLSCRSSRCPRPSGRSPHHMAAQLGSRGRGLRGAVRSAEVSKGPAFRQGRQRSYRGRISRSPGAQASGLPTASASAPPFGPIRFRHSRRNYSLSARGVQVAATTIRLAAHHFLFGIPCVFTATSRSGRVY